MAQTAEVVIMGGGIVGASIAYHLRQDGVTGRILVIERDATYARAATPMSMGGVRQQYSVPSNIALARYGLAFYERFDEIMAGAWGTPQAHFHQRGYLVLMHPTTEEALRRRYEVQRQLGVEVQLLSPADIHTMLPHLNIESITGGVYGYRDGYLNPRGALQGFVEQTRELGCTWVQDEVVEFGALGSDGMQVRLRGGETITTPALVIAAGAWTQQLAALAGIELPVVPVRRQACYATLPTLLGYKLPMVLDRVHDVSFRHDTETDNHLQITRTIRDEPAGFHFDWDSAAFATHIAPVVQHYLPDCGTLQLQRGWAGHYAVTPDENPILGPHPVYPRLFMAIGFSGHGLMLAPATGKVLSECIRQGQATTLDIQPYRLERFATGELIVDPQI
ncbi:MAG: FAD-binding oxidoreductase [Candidatus Tectomicrobia bacterium]|uniref:FAD-binding oxidoreductase n=1 Tax=Tectimicrobiota bacterium TaxID=2528274 RepID=A0A937W2X8_UNCTE|nr:FAD-binding oxidoreductase [Candidatus Tectomicrobia bacterium]